MSDTEDTPAEPAIEYPGYRDGKIVGRIIEEPGRQTVQVYDDATGLYYEFERPAP